MNLAEQKTSAFKITSQLFIQEIEKSIIRLTQCLAIEHQIKPDPEAKNIARRMIQSKLNQLLGDDEIDGIKWLIKATKENLAHPPDDYAKAVYELIKMMGLDNV